jgi:probable HAF family extracellular repeat protein
MTSLASTRSRLGRIVAIIGAILAAFTVVTLAVAGPMRADAAQQQRSPLQTFGSDLGATSASVGMGKDHATASPSGGFLYRNGRYTALDSLGGLPTGDAAINDRGEIVGSYVSDGSTVRGFIRYASGHYTGFDAVPGATTDALGVNDQGTVVGVYGVTAAHGFARSPDGKVTTIDVPGALDTYIFKINERGAMVGDYVDAQGLEHGFLLVRGVLTTIDPPGAPADPAARDTAATGINGRGQIVGYYADATGTYHGYLYHNGRFTTIDPPGAANVPDFATTVPWSINDRGQIVGQYVDAAGVLHGYLWQPGRGFTTIDPPQITSFNRGDVTGAGTVAADINDHGQILLPAAGLLYKARAVPVSS